MWMANSRLILLEKRDLEPRSRSCRSVLTRQRRNGIKSSKQGWQAKLSTTQIVLVSRCVYKAALHIIPAYKSGLR